MSLRPESPTTHEWRPRRSLRKILVGWFGGSVFDLVGRQVCFGVFFLGVLLNNKLKGWGMLYSSH